jgi:hypothetical protein
MTTVVAAAFVAATGLVGETALHKQALANTREQRTHEQRVELAAERGWVLSEQRLAAALQRATGVRTLVPTRPFTVSLSNGALAGAASSPDEVSRVLDVVSEELRRYPASLLARAGLRYLLLCSGFRQGGVAISSLPNFESTLVLDTSMKGEFLRRVVHHELFHFVDFADDGRMAEDNAWESLNDRFFTYGNGGRWERGAGAAVFGSGRTGFPSEYAMSALQEDKAEVFSFMMSAPAELHVRTARDPILREKVQAVHRTLESFAGAQAKAFLPPSR